MSYTPESERLDQEINDLMNAIRAVCEKLTNRALKNDGDWNKSHREKCLELRNRLESLQLELSDF